MCFTMRIWTGMNHTIELIHIIVGAKGQNRLFAESMVVGGQVLGEF